MRLIIKAKYTKRWKGKDGKWNYEYGKPSEKKTSRVDDVQEIVMSLKKKFKMVVINPTSNASFAKIKGLISKYGKNKTKKIMVALVETYAGSSAKAKPYIDPMKRNVDMVARLG